MEKLATHPYVSITRTIHWEEQLITEHHHQLTLYQDRLTDHTQTFTLHEILNVSYKAFNDQYGLLYVHTIKGLYPYKVKEHPKGFLTTFEQMK